VAEPVVVGFGWRYGGDLVFVDEVVKELHGLDAPGIVPVIVAVRIEVGGASLLHEHVVVTERQVVDGEHLPVPGRDLLACRYYVVPGLEGELDAGLLEYVPAVGHNHGVQLVADAVDLTLPTPRVDGGGLVDVVYVIANALF
jgi:hypothetical protein